MGHYIWDKLLIGLSSPKKSCKINIFFCAKKYIMISLFCCCFCLLFFSYVNHGIFYAKLCKEMLFLAWPNVIFKKQNYGIFIIFLCYFFLIIAKN